MKFRFAGVLLLVLLCLGCSNTSGTIKNFQDLNSTEKEALDNLIMHIYKEAFGVTGPGEAPPTSGEFRPAFFQGVTYYALPSNLGKTLDQPIDTVSMSSGFVWDSYDEICQKIDQQVHKWSMQIEADDGSVSTLRIIKYEIDYIPNVPGFSSITTITIIPVQLEISIESEASAQSPFPVLSQPPKPKRVVFIL